MRSAMVITGHHQMFAPRASEFIRYLRGECGIRYVADVHAWDRTPQDLAWVIAFHAMRAARQPFLLVYIGHGWDDGWYYGMAHRHKWLVLKHSRLVSILREREGPTLIVSDTCRAASLESRLAWRLGGPKPIGLISATGPRSVSYGELSSAILGDWRERQTYVPALRTAPTGRSFLERRRGAELDHHFFPKPE